ncbi:MAG: hypothetical protein KGR98_07305 [Verrucomicrobia bacterium]|nr:hypothetical protein [Verrucomicrobiota bacterium]MDE3098638.1 hypothetical protein [Verrucomicrobiota bacterium]
MKSPSSQSHPASAFTLIEVMFAVVCFCTATFAILALVSQSLENTRRLQQPSVDAGLVAAAIYAPTNKIYVGTLSGNLGDILGGAYDNYSWEGVADREQTNRLRRVDITIRRDDTQAIVSRERFLFYKPQSPPASLEGLSSQ